MWIIPWNNFFNSHFTFILKSLLIQTSLITKFNFITETLHINISSSQIPNSLRTILAAKYFIPKFNFIMKIFLTKRNLKPEISFISEIKFKFTVFFISEQGSMYFQNPLSQKTQHSQNPQLQSPTSQKTSHLLNATQHTIFDNR